MKLIWLVVISCLTLFTSPIFAQEDTGEFVIRIFGSEDLVSPSTPTLTSATAIATTQIDLVWSASTDNSMVSGYVVFRDSTPIATTTLTNYSDTGLVASTTYSYFVQAFDLYNNYSSSSNSLSATTPDNPAPEPVTEEPQGTAARVVVKEFNITPGVSTSSIYVNTSFPAKLEIRWGRTGSYELGYIVTDAFKSSHKALITDLEPGTIYEYQIIGHTPHGRPSVIKQGRFMTLSEVDTTSPTNVSNFVGRVAGSDVRLSWQLPLDIDLSSVRIVRNHLGFPLDPNDGSVIYQGLGNVALDKGILSQYSPVYYTAFAYDKNGNISSGSVVVVYANSVSDSAVEGSDFELLPVSNIGKQQATATESIRIPDLFELHISQGGATYTFDEKTITLSKDESFTVSIPAHAVEKHLKSIIVTLENPTDNRETFSFLLRLNKDQTAYEGVIAPLSVEGRSGVSISIYDYQTYLVASYEQVVQFVPPENLRDLFGPKENKQIYWNFILLGLLLLTSLSWLVIAKRRVEDKK